MTIKTIKLLFWLLWHIVYFFLLPSNDLTQFLEQVILLITAFELTRYYQKQHSLLIMSSVFLGWFIVLQTNLSLLIDLYEKIIAENPDIKLIASGGITSTNNLVQLNSIGCEGAIIGKALYENRITFNDLKPFL